MNKYFELQALATHVLRQLVDNTEADRKEIADIVSTHFPEFMYAGTAYRYRYDAKREFKPQAYKSYAKTIKGAKVFLANEKFGFKVEEHSVLELIEAQVTGVDLVNLTKFLISQGLLDREEVEIFFSEEEIISLEIISYKVIF